MEFNKKELYSEEELKIKMPKLYFVKKDKEDSGSWTLELHYDPDSGLYLEKGPYGRWDAMCFWILEIEKEEDWHPENYKW